MLNKNSFTATELVQFGKLTQSIKRIANSSHPLFIYPVTFLRGDSGIKLKTLLQSDFSSVDFTVSDSVSSICDTFSRIVYINTEYDSSETYIWITDVPPTKFHLYLEAFEKCYKKGGIFYA